jgi:hypothetical protein
MLTKKTTPKPQTDPPRLRRWRGPTIALASFLGVALLGVAVWLVMFYNESDETSTAGPQVTTTLPDVTTPEVVSVPDLSGLTLGEARALLADTGLEVLALPNPDDSAIVLAQEPTPGIEVDEGSVVTVDVQVTPTCNPPDPIAPEVGQTTIAVFYECGSDSIAPTPGIGVPRIVPEQGGEPIDRIEWTLRSLLAGPTDDERIAGFVSAFDAATAHALNSVTLVDGLLVVDFNDAIIVNNMNTSTGMIFFNAELHRNVFQHPKVESVEFHLNGDCGAWSGLFESDGCRITTRAHWEQDLTEWDQLRDQ